MDWFLDRKLITKNELESKIFEKNKAYTVQLAINNGICNDTFTQQFFAQQSDSIVLIPNVFSPNNDNINDCFYIQGISLTWPCSQLFVYNRWGELVFDSKTDGICWNGTSNGKPLTSGVYFYILKHLGKNYNGTVLLTN
jgi:gliding motility-associated-like protein